MKSYPLYILRLGSELRVVFPEGKQDIRHTEFWEQTVSRIVASYYGIPQRQFVDLPYCERRARVVGHHVWYGEDHDPVLLELIRKAVGDEALVFCHDEHEKRLKDDVKQFKRLVRKYKGGGPDSLI